MAARILFVVFLLPALGSAYITWLTWQAGDSSKWLFTIFTCFFVMLAVTPLFPKSKKQPEATTSTRFVPHWFMMLAILVIVLSILAAIVGAFLGH